MLRKEKESGINLISELMESFGVPMLPNKVIIPFDKLKLAKYFVTGKINLIIMGTGYYPICAYLMKLRYIGTYDEMKWIPQSSIDFNTVSGKEKVRAIVNLYGETNDNRRSLTGSLINKSLINNVQVIIGCSNSGELEAAFPYDLDTIDSHFEIWKIGK